MTAAVLDPVEGKRPRLVCCDPAGSAYWAWQTRPWRVVLRSAPHEAPLYAGLRGQRLHWTHLPDDACAFTFEADAADFIAAENLEDIAKVSR